jgi:hypothetical protein
MDLLEQIRTAMPSLPPEQAEEIVQDLAVLVLEGAIDLGNLRAGMRDKLPELKKTYPSLRYQLSLDAPVNRAEGTSMTFADVIHKPARLAKRRKRIGRPKTYEIRMSTCDNCRQRFGWKHYPGKKITQKELRRLRLIPEISPRFWTTEDIALLMRTTPRVLADVGIRSRKRTGRFCSRTCITAYFRNKRKKLPERSVLIDLYVNKKFSTCKIQKMYGVADPAVVRQALVKYGVLLRTIRESKTDSCKVPGCGKPAFKILHRGNGTLYGTLCRRHRVLHRAKLNRDYRRKQGNIPPEKWRSAN